MRAHVWPAAEADLPGSKARAAALARRRGDGAAGPAARVRPAGDHRGASGCGPPPRASEAPPGAASDIASPPRAPELAEARAELQSRPGPGAPQEQAPGSRSVPMPPGSHASAAPSTSLARAARWGSPREAAALRPELPRAVRGAPGAAGWVGCSASLQPGPAKVGPSWGGRDGIAGFRHCRALVRAAAGATEPGAEGGGRRRTPDLSSTGSAGRLAGWTWPSSASRAAFQARREAVTLLSQEGIPAAEARLALVERVWRAAGTSSVLSRLTSATQGLVLATGEGLEDAGGDLARARLPRRLI